MHLKWLQWALCREIFILLHPRIFFIAMGGIYFPGPAEVFYNSSNLHTKKISFYFHPGGLFSVFLFCTIYKRSTFGGKKSFSTTWSHMDPAEPPLPFFSTKHPQMHQMCAAWANSASSPVKHEIYEHKYKIGPWWVRNMFKNMLKDESMLMVCLNFHSLALIERSACVRKTILMMFRGDFIQWKLRLAS